MNTKRISSIVMLSYHLYSCAIELEYSCLVIIMIYEVAYTLCVMILTCSTSCLIIHMICMSKSRAGVGVVVCHSFGFAHILACRSIGLESRGIWVVSLYTGMVLGCTGTFRCDGAPRLRGRRQVVTTLSALATPTFGYSIGVHKVSCACW